jgi:hypothetical protein
VRNVNPLGSSINVGAVATVTLGSEADIELMVLEAKGRRKAARYLMPLMIKWQRFDRDNRNPNALCAVRRIAREGILVDAASDAEFIGTMLEKVRASAVLDAHSGRQRPRRRGRGPTRATPS